MGFLDKAKAAATDLAAKADTALASQGLGGPGGSGGADADRYLRDLGVLTYLEAQGREADHGQRARVVAALQEMEARGALGSLTLRTAPPPPPGAAAGGQGGAPPSPTGGGGGPAAPAQSRDEESSTPPASAPPPPPSWMSGGSAGDR